MKGSRFAGTEWSNERQSLECQTGEVLRAFKAQITQLPRGRYGTRVQVSTSWCGVLLTTEGRLLKAQKACHRCHSQMEILP